MGVNIPLSSHFLSSETYNKSSSSVHVFSPKYKCLTLKHTQANSLHKAKLYLLKPNQQGRMKKNLCTCETIGETDAKRQSCVQDCPTMRLQREACRFLVVKFQVHLLLGAGTLGHNELPLLLQLGSREPLAPDKFLPCISGRSFPIFSLLVFSDESICTAGDGIWHARSDVKSRCPDVLIPCGNPLHHT